MLNLGAGKVNHGDFLFGDYDFIVHLDRSYQRYDDNERYMILDEIEKAHIRCLGGEGPIIQFAPFDLFDFLDHYKFKFDHINADRIFEHQFYDSGEIGRLLDACNQITTDDATMDIIVPDHLKLAQELIEVEENGYADRPYPFAYHCLLQSTEWMNTRCDPHGSVWTPLTAHYYIESEGGTWAIDKITHDINHKGRDCYMKIECKKP
jgi:hypothetical protein